MLCFGNSPAFLAFCRSTEERLIRFDQSGKLRSGIMNHSLAKTVKQVPGRVMTPKTQLPLKVKPADAQRKRGDAVGCREPVLDRNL